MSYFVLSSSFSNKQHVFPFGLICELASESNRSSTMQNGFSGLFVHPLATKDHSSSSSKVVEAGLVASGVITVSLKGGSSAAFFNPGHHRITRDPKRPLQPAQATALFIGPEDLFTTFLRVGMRG